MTDTELSLYVLRAVAQGLAVLLTHFPATKAESQVRNRLWLAADQAGDRLGLTEDD